MGYFTEEIVERWSRWFIVLWAIVAVALLASAFFLPFKVWATATFIGFGVLETIGMLRHRDAYPPLTYVTRHYVPRWLTFTLIYFISGSLGGLWFGFAHPYRLGALFALLGWLTTHFDVTYDD